MEALWQDAKHALRAAARTPGFTLVAVLTLALGISANTTIFTVVNTVLLRALPFPQPEQLVVVWSKHPQIGREVASLPDFTDWHAQSESFSHMAASTARTFNWTGGKEPERLLAEAVTQDFLPLLRLPPGLGRYFLPEEIRPSGAKVIVLTNGFWQTRFGGDPGAIGRTLMLDGESHQIVGVAPKALSLPSGAVLLAPLGQDSEQLGRRSDFLFVTARLKPSVTLQQAQAEMSTITARLERQYPRTNAGWTAEVVPLHDQLVGDVRTPLLVLLGAVGLVLLIACGNVANLLTARAVAREREIAVRLALGATRARLLRQLLTESLLLALVAGGVGLLLAAWGTDMLLRLSPLGLPEFTDFSMNPAVLGFTLAVSMLTGLVFGLAPALGATGLRLNDSLKGGGQAGTGGVRGSRTRAVLLVTEMALSLVLLTGAGLLLKSFYNLIATDAGFVRDGLLTLRVDLPESQYPTPEHWVAFQQQILERLKGVSGITSATTIVPLPLSGGAVFRTFSVMGRPDPPQGQVQDARVVFVGPHFLETMKLRLRRGRDLTAQEAGARPGAVLVSESFIRRYLPDVDPLGQRIAMSRRGGWLPIAGVVRDVKHSATESESYATIYVPQPRPGITLVVRTIDDSLDLAGTVRGVLRETNADLPVFAVRSMDDVLAASLVDQRFAALLLGIFAGLAMALTAVGIYGVMAYGVAQRTHEIGVRMALGAQRRGILALVLREGLRLAAFGVVAGLGIAWFATQLLSRMLHEVSARDLPTFAMVAVLLLVVAGAACAIPARRAMRVDPIVALRYE